MVCIYNFNSSSNRLSNSFKYSFPETNLWIPFSHYFTGIINSPNIKTKQNRFFKEVCTVMGTKHFFPDVLWIIDKQFITQFWL